MVELLVPLVSAGTIALVAAAALVLIAAAVVVVRIFTETRRD